MSETSFSVNDLFRRKIETSLAMISLALVVASTLFLLLFAGRLGLGVSLMVENRLTPGFSSVFSPFIVLLGVLEFVAGVVMISFTVYVMMSHRVKDIGLVKASGCPSDILFGYFFTELLIVTIVGCSSGVVLGVLADFASTSFSTILGVQLAEGQVNLLMVVLVFLGFSALSLILGTIPILSAVRALPAKAISPMHYLGLSKEKGFRVVTKSGLTLRIAVRAMVRHASATVRVILCLSIVFLLITVTIAGGKIADSTTESWAEKAIGRDLLLIGHKTIVNQYMLMLSEFSQGHKSLHFNYSNSEYLISSDLLHGLDFLGGEISIDARLIIEAPVTEIQGLLLGNTTDDIQYVGQGREGVSLIVGVDPEKSVTDWILKGRFLFGDQDSEAVVGDTISQGMFSAPLSQGIRIFNKNFRLVGVCLDPIGNGNVTYVPLRTLENISSTPSPNILIVEINSSTQRKQIASQIRAIVNATTTDFNVSELNEILDKNVGFLRHIWSTVMLLPSFCLIAASLSLLGYVMLSINEQKQELGILRALGTRPRSILNIVSWQSLIVTLAGYTIGIAFGIIVTLIILVQEPVITIYMVVEIGTWLLFAMFTTFLSSLYPAVRFARRSLIETMNQC